MKAALYVRVSTHMQAEEGYSIGAQKERLKEYCKAKEWEVYDVYEDGGYSGGKIDRPALSQLIEDVEQFDVVLVYKLDRLSRSQKDTLYLIEDVFLENDVDFVSMNENFDTTSPFGRAMIGILSVFSQLEREQIKERMAMGKQERAKAGLYHGGGNYHPYGYDFIDGKLVVNEYEAMQIRELFDLYLQGYGTDTITQMLRDKYGGWPSSTTVRRAIDKELYIGKIVNKGNVYDGQHEPIIDEETFEKAQRMARKKQARVKRRKSKHPMPLFTGLTHCGHCGARYFRHQQLYVYKDKREPRYWYQCYSRNGRPRHMVKDKNCKNKNYRQNELESIVFDEIKRLAETSTQSFSTGLKENNNTQTVEKQLNKINAQVSRLLDLYQLGHVEYSEIDTRIQKLNDEKESLTEEISRMKQNNITRDEAIGFMSVARDTIDNGTDEQKRQLIVKLIDRIVIDDDTVNIYYNFS